MVNKVHWLSSFRFRVAEKQGEKLEALLKEKLAISKNNCDKMNWPNKIRDAQKYLSCFNG